MAAVTVTGAARSWAAAAVGKAAAAVSKARAWHLRAAIPGAVGAGLVSAGCGLKLGLWAGLIVAGLFCLRLDSRL